MTLELRFRKFWFLPDLIQAGSGGSRRAHFVGKKQPIPVDKQDQGQPNDQPPSRGESDDYRPLTSIRLGAVDAAMRFFLPQLVVSPVEGWVARGYFCQIPVIQRTTSQSPVVFGRVQTMFPSDGHIQNVDQLEMLFPNKRAEPDPINIHRNDIDWQRPVQSYCVGVRMFLSEAELEDFRRSENIFIEKGFAPLYETSPLDLLDLNEHNHSSLHWLNVVGSEWFASLPDTVQPEIRERLRDMAGWGNVILNYHPRRYSLRYYTLNEELDFQYGFTRHFLISPQDTNQALQIVEQIFGEYFMRGMS